uniref:Variant surface glycoprotein 1125.1652 n=1 Tax=Trypanosoma brucei TaxID=5691 RepID=A0A1J0R7F6_9TRYP|nr:variant surface glycoprotein 1125.1652 [Trypanosoma brucei]
MASWKFYKEAVVKDIVLALYSITYVSASSDTIGHDITKWCHELSYLKKIRTGLISELGTRNAAQERTAGILTQWRIAAASSDDPTAENNFKALLMYGTKRQAEAISHANSLTAAIAEFLPIIDKRIEAYSAAEIAATVFRTATPTTRPTAPSGSNAANCKILLALAAEQEYQCAFSPGDTEGGTSTVPQKLKTATKIKLAQDATPALLSTPVELTLGVAGQTDAFDSSQNQAGKCKTGSGGSAITPGTHYVAATLTSKTRANPTTEDVNIADGNEQSPQGKEANKVTPWLNNKLLAQKLHNVQLLLKKPVFDLETTTYANLEAAVDLATVLTNLQGTKENGAAPKSTADQPEPAVVIRKAFKTGSSDFATTYITGIKDKPVKYKNGGKTEDTTISALATSADLNLALAYLEGLKADKRQAAPPATDKNPSKKADTEDKTVEKKDGDNKATAADCTGTEEDKCDTKKCDWNAEKKQCKVKEGAVVISSVIKAPLLLVFLLF